jgi:hypothetical protein
MQLFSHIPYRRTSLPELYTDHPIQDTQIFSVFQAHYGRHESVQENVLRPNELLQRALIFTIGPFGNGGLVGAVGAFCYSYLPNLGRHTRSLCIAGTALIALGFASAAGSHSVRRVAWSINRLAVNVNTVGNTCGMLGRSGRSWSRNPEVRSYTHSAGVLPRM